MNKRQRRLQSLQQWTLALFIALAVMALCEPSLKGLENRISDNRFRLPHREIKVDPSIVLVLIDDKSFKDIATPTTFWAPYFAKVEASLLKAGALSVGVDYMPYDIDADVFQTLGPKFFLDVSRQDLEANPWLPLLEELQKREHAPFVQGLYPDVDGVQPQGQYRPATELMSMLHPNQMALLNISRDDDSVLRFQTIIPLRRTQREWQTNVSSYPPLAGRMAELTSGKQIDAELSTFGGVPLELFDREALRINYPTRAGKFPTYSFSDVYRNCQKPDELSQLFKGKSVLIGSGTRLLKDLVTTPIGEMYGVETHAWTLNTLLTQQFLTSWTVVQRWSLFLTLAGFTALLGVELTSLPGLLAVLLIAAGYSYFVEQLFLSHLLILPLAQPLLGAWVAWGLGTLLRARAQAEEKKHIRQLFGRYVSPTVMETLLQDPSQAMLGAVGKRKITVLFSDINGFSGHCEKKTPEKIMQMLNRYFEDMNRIIFEQGGTIKQFVGDEIMAMYGAPTSHTHPEVAAVESAIAMIRRLDELHKEDPNEDDGFYLIKVGIHTGDVILGNVGSLERAEYAAVGDDVNLGSRIMSMTKALQGDILISKEVFEKVSHLKGMSFVSKGAHLVKGRQTPVEIYQIIPDELKEVQ